MSDILHDFGKAAKADGADAPQADAVPSVNHAPAPSAALGTPCSSPAAGGRPTTAQVCLRIPRLMSRQKHPWFVVQVPW